MSENLHRAQDLLFGVQRSMRYHSHREGWFTGWHRAVSFFTLLAAGMVGVALREDFGVDPLYFVLVIAILQGIELTVRLAERAAQHKILGARFAQLESLMLPLRAFDDEVYQRFMAERILIESGEPKDMMLLNVLCHFEQAIATNPDADLRMLGKISAPRRWAAHLFSQSGYVAQLERRVLAS